MTQTYNTLVGKQNPIRHEEYGVEENDAHTFLDSRIRHEDSLGRFLIFIGIDRFKEKIKK